MTLSSCFDLTSVFSTYAHSTTPDSPLSALKQLSANLCAAAAMLRVADPVPAFASTTSVPAFCILCVSALTFSIGRLFLGVV